jgi:2-aminoethylphosphonate-pyruvate transaminase
MLLLIPGPVSTDSRVRAAAAQDYAPWDHDFRAIYARVRQRVLALAGGRDGVHATLPLPGCGHFAMEAAFRSFIPAGGRMLLPMTGQYADRLLRLATEAGRVVVPLPVPDDERASPEAVRRALEADPTISHLACVYSETSTGIIHDIPALARAAGLAGRRVIVDAVSAFGALPFDISALPMVDSVSFTSNKCLEGLPGTSFTVAPVDRLIACKGQAGSWSFDLPELYAHALQAGWGSHRFTPAAGVIAAFDVALDLFDAEGGRPARLARCTATMRALHDGVRGIGLHPTLSADLQGPIVVNVDAPPDPAWNLQAFVDGLKTHGFVISNFYNTKHPSFRVGCIGAITPDDMRRAVAAMGAVLAQMGIQQRKAA